MFKLFKRKINNNCKVDLGGLGSNVSNITLEECSAKKNQVNNITEDSICIALNNKPLSTTALTLGVGNYLLREEDVYGARQQYNKWFIEDMNNRLLSNLLSNSKTKCSYCGRVQEDNNNGVCKGCGAPQ